MIRKSLVLFSILAVFISLFTATPTFAASNSKPSPLDFTSISKSCAVVSVHLDGKNHTVSCRKTRPSGIQGHFIPLIGRDDYCDTTMDNMIIWNTQAGNGTILCFWGVGYTGVGILHVNEIDDIVPSNTEYYNAYGEWFRSYPGGTYTGLIPGRSKIFATSGVTNILVTQLCIGSSNYTYCP